MVVGRQGDDAQAAQHLEAALALLRRIGDRSGTASVLTDLGSVACRQGRHREASRYQRQALALFRMIGERAGEAEALNGLGEVLLATAKPGPAHVRHAEALALASESGDPYQQHRARDGLAFSERAYVPDRSRPSTAGRECPKTTGSPHDSHTSRALSG